MIAGDGKDRLIVALDVPRADDALALVERLQPDVTFFKIGWQLFITGEIRPLLERLRALRVFVDLKVPGDIGNTIGSVVTACSAMGVRLLTLSDSVPPAAVRSAIAARAGGPYPRLLSVPLLSSLDAADLPADAAGMNVDAHILSRARASLAAGVDGLIASGSAIGLLRRECPAGTLIVSPGIRPAGSTHDDHKRSTTPAQAIALGADYLVVGRPIHGAADPRAAARRIIDEIDAALERAGAAR